MISVFLIFSIKPVLSCSSFTLIKRLFSSLHCLPLQWYHLHIWVCLYFSCLSWFQLATHPAWHFPCAYHIDQTNQVTALVYFFLNLEPMSCSIQGYNCCFLTCIQVSQETGKMVWYSHLFKSFPQFIMIHTVKGFGIVNEIEVDVFLEFPSFVYDPANIDNLMSGSSSFPKLSLDTGSSWFA